MKCLCRVNVLNLLELHFSIFLSLQSNFQFKIRWWVAILKEMRGSQIFTLTFTVIHSVSSAPYHPQNNSSFSSQTSRGGAVTDPSALPSLAVTATMAARACMSLRLHKQQTSSLRPSLSPARASDDTRLRLSNTAHVRNGTEAQSC